MNGYSYNEQRLHIELYLFLSHHLSFLVVNNSVNCHFRKGKHIKERRPRHTLYQVWYNL